MQKKSWMAALASHYEDTRHLYHEDRLMILFDIDGTILDMRYMVLFVLKAFDKKHKTPFFQKLQLSDITVHENQVDHLLKDGQIPPEMQREIIDWYHQHRWSPEYVINAHRPFSGVIEVIRWFQLQPNTFVGLNSGRSESVRGDTLRSLNQLGEECRVRFTDELLYMSPHEWHQNVQEAKVSGVRHFQKAGYRVIAFIDNEPDNLTAVSKIDPDKQILLFHANTIFESKRARLPDGTVKGKEYDLTELIPENALPRQIQLAWHGLNDEVNLRQFLASDNIQWGECDVRLDPIDNEVILRHDSFVNTPLDLDEEPLGFDRLLERLRSTDKSIKIDLKLDGFLSDRVLEFIDTAGFDDSRLWFNGSVETLLEQGFRKLASAHPDSILQCPIDFLAPLICGATDKAKEILEMFTSWGINRFSIDWQNENLHPFFDQMAEWEFDVNIYNVSDLESFLQAMILMPRSITSDFNFPKWHYYGRGSGKEGDHYEYQEKRN